MAVSKTASAITQLTSSGDSSTISNSAGIEADWYVKHTNGTGTITVGGVVTVNVRPNGSSTWYNFCVLNFGLTASTVETRVVRIPGSTAETRVNYVIPSGGSGHLCDAELGRQENS